jgi:Flp pilus assembly protein TadB
MKKLVIITLAVLAFGPLANAQNTGATSTEINQTEQISEATTGNTSEASNTSIEQAGDAYAQQLTTRLKEIKDMDKSNLNADEKSELRSEVLAIQENMQSNNGGIYLSVGAVIVIILLLILLL